MEPYWKGAGWTSKPGQEMEGYWEGPGIKKKSALSLFNERLVEMKENNPAAFYLLLRNLDDFKNNILQSSGIASAVNRLQSSMTAGVRVAQAKLDFLIGKAAATNPVIANFQNFINNMSFEIERTMQENWVGSTVFGMIGAGLSTVAGLGPGIGYQAGAFTGGYLELYYSTLSPVTARRDDPFGLFNIFKGLGALGKLIEIWLSGGPAVLPWQGTHDREPPPLDPVDINRQEVESMKRYIRRYNLI